MHRCTKTVVLGLAMLLSVPTLMLASGGSGAPSGAPPIPNQSPEQRALDAYNRGLRSRNKAWKLEEKMKGLEGSELTKLEGKMEQSFSKAVDAYRKAIELNPELYQAYGSMGYALRRLGEYESALGSYNRALELNPNYPEAIEYRAEAYLGLNRTEEAQRAYAQLRIYAPALADELLAAFGEWIDSRRADPAGLDTGTVERIADWVRERRDVAAVTSSAEASRGSAWK